MKKGNGRNKFRGASIQKKLILSTWAAAVVPIAIIFMIVFFVFYNVNVDNSKRQSQLLLDKTVAELDGCFTQAREAMNLLITDMNAQIAIARYETESFKDKLDFRDFIRYRMANMTIVNQRAVNISVYIKDSQKTFSRDFVDRELYQIYGGTPWFQRLMSGEQSFYQMEGTSIVDGRPVYILASNIVSVNDGQVIGMVYLELDKEKLEQLFADLTVDSADAILVGEKRIASEKYRDGEQYVSVYAHSGALDEDIEYRIQLKELRRGYGKALVYFLGGMALLILLIYLVDKILADWFAARIIVLRDATREIATGNLDVEVRDCRRDEIGELAGSLNTMVRDMKQLIENEYLVKIESQQATLRALQSQINPHFIYNTLESISMMALIHDQYDIADMAQAFSSMMRYSMEDGTLVTVKEEVENVRNFVTIQKLRFPGRFEVYYRINADCMERKVPRLSIQPLVENAFKHGFEEVLQQRNLIISVCERRDRLVIRIFNDGIAISKERILRIRKLLQPDCSEKTMDCFALRNLSRRLRLIFGEDSTFMIHSKEGIGTIAAMKIPIHGEDGE